MVLPMRLIRAQKGKVAELFRRCHVSARSRHQVGIPNTAAKYFSEEAGASPESGFSCNSDFTPDWNVAADESSIASNNAIFSSRRSLDYKHLSGNSATSTTSTTKSTPLHGQITHDHVTNFTSDDGEAYALNDDDHGWLAFLDYGEDECSKEDDNGNEQDDDECDRNGKGKNERLELEEDDTDEDEDDYLYDADPYQYHSDVPQAPLDRPQHYYNTQYAQPRPQYHSLFYARQLQHQRRWSTTELSTIIEANEPAEVPGSPRAVQEMWRKAHAASNASTMSCWSLLPQNSDTGSFDSSESQDSYVGTSNILEEEDTVAFDLDIFERPYASCVSPGSRSVSPHTKPEAALDQHIGAGGLSPRSTSVSRSSSRSRSPSAHSTPVLSSKRRYSALSDSDVFPPLASLDGLTTDGNNDNTRRSTRPRCVSQSEGVQPIDTPVEHNGLADLVPLERMWANPSSQTMYLELQHIHAKDFQADYDARRKALAGSLTSVEEPAPRGTRLGRVKKEAKGRRRLWNRASKGKKDGKEKELGNGVMLAVAEVDGAIDEKRRTKGFRAKIRGLVREAQRVSIHITVARKDSS